MSEPISENQREVSRHTRSLSVSMSKDNNLPPSPDSQTLPFLLRPSKNQEESGIDKLAEWCKQNIANKEKALASANRQVQTLEVKLQEQSQRVSEQTVKNQNMAELVKSGFRRYDQMEDWIKHLSGQYDIFISVTQRLKEFISTHKQVQNNSNKMFERLHNFVLEKATASQQEKLHAMEPKKAFDLFTHVLSLSREIEEAKDSIKTLQFEKHSLQVNSEIEIRQMEAEKNRKMETLEQTNDLRLEVQEISSSVGVMTGIFPNVHELFKEFERSYTHLKSSISTINATISELEVIFDIYEGSTLEKGVDTRNIIEELKSQLDRNNIDHAETCRQYTVVIKDLKDTRESMSQELKELRISDRYQYIE
ncbi:hypothetical protein BDF14DRAFT_41961 [Spinellus fusiger]|nr:hypothetical protein BDF14DRAFT_41961 [Spinellus fusiger]